MDSALWLLLLKSLDGLRLKLSVPRMPVMLRFDPT
ncbi:hypothetical protein GGR95_003653 [Sulfitobacter undariae]|uniref:Uncharacterized protein n=1 Tax=Sulfitobacter undariae TaxID=1563671 RepID=A0A7W6H2D5_9RHOB|nr:hypothetical protein [Sulfitobacter undariae]